MNSKKVWKEGFTVFSLDLTGLTKRLSLGFFVWQSRWTWERLLSDEQSPLSSSCFLNVTEGCAAQQQVAETTIRHEASKAAQVEPQSCVHVNLELWCRKCESWTLPVSLWGALWRGKEQRGAFKQKWKVRTAAADEPPLKIESMTD